MTIDLQSLSAKLNAPAANFNPGSIANGDQAKIKEVAKEFEALLIDMLFKAMRTSLNKDDDPLHGGFSQEIFEDMLYQNYAKTMADQGSLGVAAIIERSIAREQAYSASNIAPARAASLYEQ